MISSMSARSIKVSKSIEMFGGGGMVSVLDNNGCGRWRAGAVAAGLLIVGAAEDGDSALGGCCCC